MQEELNKSHILQPFIKAVFVLRLAAVCWKHLEVQRMCSINVNAPGKGSEGGGRRKYVKVEKCSCKQKE